MSIKLEPGVLEKIAFYWKFELNRIAQRCIVAHISADELYSHWPKRWKGSTVNADGLVPKSSALLFLSQLFYQKPSICIFSKINCWTIYTEILKNNIYIFLFNNKIYESFCEQIFWDECMNWFITFTLSLFHKFFQNPNYRKARN